MKYADNKKIRAFVNACHKVADFGLLLCSSGNMSCRLDDKLAILSASGAWLGEITARQVAICRIDNGQCINGLTPTMENKFHLGILCKRPEVNVVLHCQSPFATAIACGNPNDYNFNLITEVTYHVKHPAVVKYLLPGSEALADAVIAAIEEHDLAVLRNHGLVTVGRDFNDAIQKACFFELACQILLCQDKPQFLSKSAIGKIMKFSSKV
jgi:ribulose-5-phosphate 4-epimerase/fuculose-1-phosphate aldolase